MEYIKLLRPDFPFAKNIGRHLKTDCTKKMPESFKIVLSNPQLNTVNFVCHFSCGEKKMWENFCFYFQAKVSLEKSPKNGRRNLFSRVCESSSSSSSNSAAAAAVINGSGGGSSSRGGSKKVDNYSKDLLRKTIKVNFGKYFQSFSGV